MSTARNRRGSASARRGITVRGGASSRRRVAEFESWSEVVPITDDVLDGTDEEFPLEPVRTVDAIHLSTMHVLAETLPDLDVVSADDRVRENARAIGLNVLP